MDANVARLEMLSAAVRAIANALPRSAAHAATRELRVAAELLARCAQDPDADAAMAGELAALLAALSREASWRPGDRSIISYQRT